MPLERIINASSNEGDLMLDPLLRVRYYDRGRRAIESTLKSKIIVQVTSGNVKPDDTRELVGTIGALRPDEERSQRILA